MANLLGWVLIIGAAIFFFRLTKAAYNEPTPAHLKRERRMSTPEERQKRLDRDIAREERRNRPATANDFWWGIIAILLMMR